MTSDKRPGRRSGVYLTADDDARIEALGAPLGVVLRAGIAALEGRVQRPLQTPETLASLDKTARHPGDKLPDPKPPTPHGWRRQGLRWIARAGSLDDAARLASMAVGAKLAAPYVPLTAEEVNDGS